MQRRILVVASHPDDEILGVGGTLSRFVREGADAHVLILGEGITSRQVERDPEQVSEALAKLRGEVSSAAKRLGVTKSEVLSFPDNRFDTVALLDIIKAIEERKKAFKPTIVFTQHEGDLNVDHQRTSMAVLAAFRPLPGEAPVEIFGWETLSSTEWKYPGAHTAFSPTTFVQLEERDVVAKMAAMEMYSSEKRESPHPRSPEAIRALAVLRGSSIGSHFAEAFTTIRRIV